MRSLGKPTRGVFAAALVAACALPAWGAGELLTVDKSVIALGDTVQIEIEVPSGDAKIVGINVSPPLNLQSAGTQNSMTIVNGKMTSKSSHRYRVTPTQPGQYTIGPAVLRVDGKDVKTNALTVVVQAGGSERYLELQADLEPTRVYVGQPFAEAVTAIFGSDLRPVGWSPAAANSIVDPFGGQRTDQRDGKIDKGGAVLQAVTLRRWLYAARPGTVELAGGRLEFEVQQRQQRSRSPFANFGFDPFGSRSTRQAVELTAQKLVVRDLPRLPDGMSFMGVVGELRAGWDQIDRRSNQLRAVLILQGKGSAPALDVDSWVENGWRVYADKPEHNYNLKDNELVLTVKIPVTIVPVNDATTAVPAWFDPVRAEYIKVRLPLEERPGQAARDTADGTGEAAPLLPPPATKQLVVAQDPGWVKLLSAQRLAWAAGAGFLMFALGCAAPFARRAESGRQSVEAILAKAMAADTLPAWQAAYVALAQHEATDERIGVLREIVAGAIYAPTFQSPMARVRDWQSSGMTTS